jgi:hypothetical protein
MLNPYLDIKDTNKFWEKADSKLTLNIPIELDSIEEEDLIEILKQS